MKSSKADAAYYLGSTYFADGRKITQADFDPGAAISSEQLASVLYLYAGFKGYDTSAGEDVDIPSYDDACDISEYAVSAMQYVVGSGFINGKTISTLTPKDNTTRAEIAVIFQRFIEKVK